MIEKVKGTVHLVNGKRHGQFETETKDGYICMWMFDSVDYEYFKPSDISYEREENENNRTL